MDPLSDILSLLRLRRSGVTGFDLDGDWSFRFPQHRGIKCYAVDAGECWLTVDGVTEPAHLVAGDCFLLPSGRSFCLASHPHLSPQPYEALMATGTGEMRTLNGGGGCFLVGGHFALTEGSGSRLLEALSPIVHVQGEQDRTALRFALERMAYELREQRPGSSLLVEHLAHMMLVQALRSELERNAIGVGWFFALADPRISAAIEAIHASPSHPWTLQQLAAHAGMSRSSFASRFKEKVGSSPIDYLTHWRMLLAEDRLTHSDDPISSIAIALGYESRTSFSTAFKRVIGYSPKRRQRSGRDSSATLLEPDCNARIGATI